MQVTGVVFVNLDGKLLRSKEGAKLNLGGKERTPIVGHAVYGYSEKVAPATVECTLSHTADTDLIALNNTTNSTLVFETDTGKSYLITHAFLTKPPELTGGEGDTAIEFAGDPAVEQ